MKKILMSLAVAMGLASASCVFAADVSSYVTGSMSSPKTFAAAGKAAISPTDIVISNATNFGIYFTLPGSGRVNFVAPRDWGYVKHSSATDPVRIQIEDEYYNVFWDHTVCSRAVLVVTGLYDGGVQVNSEYCR